jgi:hypothetical protein
LNDEYSHLRGLLLQFPDFQKPFQNYEGAENALLHKVAALHSAADRAYLERKFPAEACRGHMSEDNRYIFLTPFKEHTHTFLPLLSVDIAFDRPWPLVSINALHYAIPTMAQGGAEPLRCFGYRYDKPAVAHGDHNYFHVQIAHGFPKGVRNPNVDDWMSTKDPSIPVDATNTVELFLAAVLALRNKTKARREYLDEWSQAGLPINSFLAPMAFERWKPPRPPANAQQPA